MSFIKWLSDQIYGWIITLFGSKDDNAPGDDATDGTRVDK